MFDCNYVCMKILQFCIRSNFRTLDSFSLCCYATRVLKDVDCEYPLSARDSFSSCNRMIEDSGPRKIIWLLGVLAVLGNLAVIAWRLIRRDDHPVQTCLLTNLAVSDFLMGVYLMIVAIQDQIWAGTVFNHRRNWKSHKHCIEQLTVFLLLHEKLLQIYWLRAVVFQLNLKYLHV